MIATWSGIATTNRAKAADNVVLLVPGIKLDAVAPIDIQSTYGAMISKLTRGGRQFGGVIWATHLRDREYNGDVFLVEFSAEANANDHIPRAIQLSHVLKHVHDKTGRRIDLVCHSAGGLVSRVVLQGASPKAPDSGCVDRCITIGTPHLGSALAANFGKAIGKQAECLSIYDPLIKRLNTELPLNPRVEFASIITRTIGVAVREPGLAYKECMTGTRFECVKECLSQNFSHGSDQVVHVLSQNLRNSPVAEAYEKKTGKPIHAIVARVPYPGNLEWAKLIDNAHSTALKDPMVLAWVYRLLSDDGGFWKGKNTNTTRLMNWEARYAAFGLIEGHAYAEHGLREVHLLGVEQFTVLEPPSLLGSGRFHYAGTARWIEAKTGVKK
ncbi:MAG: hypothetical protein KDA84_08100, partial [Planctomycetaceae bacterium]|nr:hypothetical protein [Planctomycetaceae bacterium]